MLGSSFFGENRSVRRTSGCALPVAFGHVSSLSPCRVCLSAGQIISGPRSGMELKKSRIDLDSSLTS